VFEHQQHTQIFSSHFFHFHFACIQTTTIIICRKRRVRGKQNV
jgi:hypothetical protein